MNQEEIQETVMKKRHKWNEMLEQIDETIKQMELLKEKLHPDDVKVMQIHLALNSINSAIETIKAVQANDFEQVIEILHLGQLKHENIKFNFFINQSEKGGILKE